MFSLSYPNDADAKGIKNKDKTKKKEKKEARLPLLPVFKK